MRYDFNKVEVKDNVLAQALINNRAYTDKLSAIDVEKATVKVFRGLEDTLHSEAYKVYAECYNKCVKSDSIYFNAELATVDKSGIYNALRAIFEKVGEVNGATLRCNEVSAQVVLGFCAKMCNGYSPEMMLLRSKKSNATKLLAEYEATAGVSEDSINAIKTEILSLEVQIAKLEELPGNKFKTITKANSSTFYKALEDYIADMIEVRAIMTEEEVQAELEAKRAARRAKTAQKKSQKKAEVPSANIEAQAVVNA